MYLMIPDNNGFVIFKHLAGSGIAGCMRAMSTTDDHLLNYVMGFICSEFRCTLRSLKLQAGV